MIRSVLDNDPSLPPPALTYDEAKIDQLLRFAATTPAEKIQLLGHMLEFLEIARRAKAIADTATKPAVGK